MRRPLASLALFAAVPLAACGDAAEAPSAPAQRYAGPTLTVAQGETADWRDVSAMVTSVDQAQAMARIPGVLTSLSVKEGDRVARGQVIGRIVDSQLGYQGSAYGAQAAAAEAQAAQARAELARTKFLYDNGVYARARLDQAEAAARAADAQIRAARAQQSAVSAVAGQGAVTAPSAGRVLIADVPAGSAVAPGMAIATITSGPVVLRLSLPESLAATVRPGAAVIADFGSGQSRRGSVTTVYPAVSGGQVSADVAIDGLDDRLIGRRVAAKVEAGRRPAILVPRTVVKTSYGVDSVRLVGRDGSLATVPVQLAPTVDPARVEILSGVAPGDRLATGGAR
ncbi:RND family efflux transporter MFP subunit [Sphingomonas sp. BE123]|uniref:efflux RND transporter periplasmic adaptor subunit n=1 Tax=Sphingomonas sp. BE123 TaxID=2817842 RepID=UPI0028658558|nr:efflux RND transporter periplasmic adaptor subunit [Sphingomonas sp. BE123]MDR6851121.1 RND family efflux transporter MFP subunit [Sphingomonas sp. BE123]